MRPRARDKKLQQEWVVPLKGIEDVQEVAFHFPTLIEMFSFSCFLALTNTLSCKNCHTSEIQRALSWKLEKQSVV